MENMEVQQNMLVTLVLSLNLMAALFVMIFAAVALVQDRRHFYTVHGTDFGMIFPSGR